MDHATMWCFIKDQIYGPSINRSLIFQLPEGFIAYLSSKKSLFLFTIVIPVKAEAAFEPCDVHLCLVQVCLLVFSFYTSLAVNETSSSQFKASSSQKAYLADLLTVDGAEESRKWSSALLSWFLMFFPVTRTPEFGRWTFYTV